MVCFFATFTGEVHKQAVMLLQAAGSSVQSVVQSWLNLWMSEALFREGNRYCTRGRPWLVAITIPTRADL